MTEDLPAVEGDASQLYQLFQNLGENAIEYSGDEPPRVTVSATQADDEWILSVSDEGIGIASENQDRIFEVFQRLHAQDERAGTGIGLALCERIVDRKAAGSGSTRSGTREQRSRCRSRPGTITE